MENDLLNSLLKQGLNILQACKIIRSAQKSINLSSAIPQKTYYPITIKYILWRHCILEPIALLEQENVNGCNDVIFDKLKELEIK